MDIQIKNLSVSFPSPQGRESPAGCRYNPEKRENHGNRRGVRER